jgi:outer membrane murein-binding lipoprotein Lpp
MRFPLLVPIVLCSTVVLAGCGSSNLLDGSSADDLQASIARVEKAVDDGRCEEAMAAATEGLSRVEELPSSVDSKLRSRLRQGFEELEQRIPSDCTPRETTTTEPPPTTTTEPPPTTTSETPTTTETPTDTTPTETTPTVPPETTTEDEVPLGDEDSGGTPPDDAGTEEIDPATPRGLRELRQNMRELRDSGREARKQFEEAVRDATDRFRGDR